jgi:cyclopropane-fatty-acyl-phospholipid synthase
MEWLLCRVLKRFISVGNLCIATAAGTSLICGDETGTPAAIRFRSDAALFSVLLNPELKFGEAYMDGDIIVERGSIADVLAILLGQPAARKPRYWMRIAWLLRYLCRRIEQFNPPEVSRRNVAHHYDLDDSLYRLFLDADCQYSCAYFESTDQSLDDAQLGKKRHLAAKLILRPSHRVLEIGCGWGGLALYLSEFCEVQVTGITLSERQLAIARCRAAERGLSKRVNFELWDYRSIGQVFDRLVSVGMFEHVGVGFYDAFFRHCAALLADDGVMLLSSTGRSDGPNATCPWITKYIFPGGYIPALSEVLPAVERAGFLVTDIEILRLHYAETLRAWRERFLVHREAIQQVYDERFVRMWEFYLAASEMAFRKQGMMVFQLQLTKRQGVVPLTREYMVRESARLRAIDHARIPTRLTWPGNNLADAHQFGASG